MLTKEIGLRLKEIRKENGYTQEQFSELMEMSLNFMEKLSVAKAVYLLKK